MQPPQWTWHCANQRCERHHAKGATSLVSFSTCSMLCGSTQLWPQPTGPVLLASKATTFHLRNLQFELSATSSAAKSLLEEAAIAFNASLNSLVTDDNYQNGEMRRLLIRISTQSKMTKLRLATNESYTLTIKTSEDDEVTANIEAQSFFGARHGLETLSQLIWWDDYAANGGALSILRGASVKDGPAFAYRGLMLDTARNFMSLDSLKRVVLGMAANKLNVFHWHITDTQSFPLLLKKSPLLAKTGAYSSEMVYTTEDVEDLVKFALVRGVRVVLEVDTPAHAGNG